MPLSDFDGDFPVYTADILNDTADPNDYDASPDFQKTGEVRVVVIERGGSEAFRLGLSVSDKTRAVYSDLVSGAAAFSTNARLLVRGETLDVLSVVVVDARGDEICIAETNVM